MDFVIASSSDPDSVASHLGLLWLQKHLRRTFERIERTNEWKQWTFERQKSRHLGEMENNPFERITCISVN